jgi:hypothetical protein
MALKIFQQEIGDQEPLMVTFNINSLSNGLQRVLLEGVLITILLMIKDQLKFQILSNNVKILMLDNYVKLFFNFQINLQSLRRYF